MDKQRTSDTRYEPPVKLMTPNLELGDGEKIIFSSEIGKLSMKQNMIAVITSDRFIVREKKANSLMLEDRSVEQDLDEIVALRERESFSAKRVIVETHNDIIELPKMKKDNVDELLDELIDAGGYVKSEWEQEGQATEEKAARAGLAAILGSLGLLGSFILGAFGVILAIIGFMLSLSIIGAIVGVPLILLGGWLVSGAVGIGWLGISSGAIAGGSISEGEREWVHPSRVETE